MAKRSKSSSESGIALLLAIFTLMLLSALGLALLGAADLETQVAANYRDKQSSIYASLSGLQEARDRLIPSLCQASSCNAPAIDTRNLDLPVPDEKYVIYIINPDTAHGETASDIKPWDPANKYYDSDLCNTPYFAAKLCTGGLPPTSNDWYRIYNDSNSLQGSYYTPGSSALPNPMQYKWVRVTLKADNMTEMPARWSSGPTNTTDGSQMCWQGTYEVPTTSGPGYNKACQSGGGVTLSYNGAQCSPTCTFNPPIGSNFTAANITITPPSSGTTALATATLASVNDGRVNSIYLSAPNNGGSGYTKAPLVTIDASPTGDNATAVAKLGGSPVTGYNLAAQSDPIGCYSGTPSVAVSGGSGDGATAVAAMTGPTCIAGWSVGVASGCTDPFLQNGKTITVSGSGGSGSNFAGKITFAAGGGGVTDAVITDPGSGYSTPPTGVVNGANKLNNCSLNITWTLGKEVSAVNLGPGGGGNGYQDTVPGRPSVKIDAPTQPAGQNAPTATAIVPPSATPDQVTAVILTHQGSGYGPTAPNVIIAAPSTGTQATATATLGMTQGISSITLTNAGNGYTTDPGVILTDGTVPGSLKAKATLSTLGRIYVLTSMAVNEGGSKTLSQMEAATPPFVPFSTPAPLVLDNPSPLLTPGNSTNYQINGNDKNSCGQAAVAPKPAVGVFDDPHNPSTPTAVECVTSELGGTLSTDPACAPGTGVKATNYPGANPSPDVENVYNQLGDLTTPAGVDSLATMIESQADYTYPGPVDCQPGAGNCVLNLGNPAATPPDCPTKVITGDAVIGPVTGCGVLLVTGSLEMDGAFVWDGPIFVIGSAGSFTAGGGGNGVINGSLFVAKDRDSSGNILPALAPPTINMFTVSGGGGTSIYYDHCWSDNMMTSLNNPAKSSKPLKVLSLHTMY